MYTPHPLFLYRFFVGVTELNNFYLSYPLKDFTYFGKFDRIGFMSNFFNKIYQILKVF